MNTTSEQEQSPVADCGCVVSLYECFFLVLEMDAWRENLEAGWRAIVEDEEDNDFFVSVVMGGHDSDEELLPRIGRGSRVGRAPNIERDRHSMHQWMMRDYFSTTLVYGARLFRPRFK